MNCRLTSAAFVFAVSTLLSTCGLAQQINHAKFLAQQAALSALEGPDAFTLRETFLSGEMTPGEPKLVPQQLFKQNSYQFWFAVSNPNVESLLNIYDSDGLLLEADTVRFPPQKNVISIVITPKSTGLYYLRLAINLKTKTDQDWALIYAYK